MSGAADASSLRNLSPGCRRYRIPWPQTALPPQSTALAVSFGKLLPQHRAVRPELHCERIRAL